LLPTKRRLTEAPAHLLAYASIMRRLLIDHAEENAEEAAQTARGMPA